MPLLPSAAAATPSSSTATEAPPPTSAAASAAKSSASWHREDGMGPRDAMPVCLCQVLGGMRLGNEAVKIRRGDREETIPCCLHCLFSLCFGLWTLQLVLHGKASYLGPPPL